MWMNSTSCTSNCPPVLQPGPVKITVQPVTEEGEDDGWRALINKSWPQDRNDPRGHLHLRGREAQP